MATTFSFATRPVNSAVIIFQSSPNGTPSGAIADRFGPRVLLTSVVVLWSVFTGLSGMVRSYVPLVARHFVAGRGFRDESCNAPACCDLAQLFGVDFDRMTFAEVKGWLDATAARGGWLVLAGHDMGANERQGV
mgnify:CR=1 FL=1